MECFALLYCAAEVLCVGSQQAGRPVLCSEEDPPQQERSGALSRGRLKTSLLTDQMYTHTHTKTEREEGRVTEWRDV
jgi:hypothetical protein